MYCMAESPLVKLWEGFVEKRRGLFEEDETFLWFDPVEEIYRSDTINYLRIVGGTDREERMYWRIHFMVKTSELHCYGEVQLWSDGIDAIEWGPDDLNEHIVQKEEE